MEKFDKYGLPLLTGAINLYYLLLALMMVFIFVTFNGDFFHSLPTIGLALIIYHPLSAVVLVVGAIAGLVYRLKFSGEGPLPPWGFTGVWQILTCFIISLMLLTAAELILPRPAVELPKKENMASMIMEIQETKDIDAIIRACSHQSPDIRIIALNRLIPSRYNRVRFTKEQATNVAKVFMKSLKDTDSQVRDLALSYTDDITNNKIGRDNYTMMDLLDIRRIYQKAMFSEDFLNRESALLNVGNLIRKNDPEGPVFYRSQLMRAYSDIKLKPHMKSKLVERDILVAANFSAESFYDLIDWAIELLDRPNLDSRIWREAIKFLSKFDVPPAKEKLAQLLEAETEEAKRLFIEDCIRFKGVIPMNLESSEIKMEMKLKEERLKERMQNQGTATSR